jgi:hypothetical protein
MKVSEQILAITTPDAGASGIEPSEEGGRFGVVASPRTDVGLGLKYRLAFLSLFYRYLVCLFCIGVLTTLGIVGLLLYESVAMTMRLLVQ